MCRSHRQFLFVREASQLILSVRKSHYPPSVMVWWALSYDGVTKINFYEKGVPSWKPLWSLSSNQIFANKPWTFQQDSAPAHKQKRLNCGSIPTFQTTYQPLLGSAGSLNCNPLDYKLWFVLKGVAFSTQNPNIEPLKWTVRAVDNFPMHEVCLTIIK